MVRVRQSPSGKFIDIQEAPGPEYGAQLLASIDPFAFPAPRAFSQLTFPRSDLGLNQWQKGSAPPPDGTLTAGPLQGGLWTPNLLTGELTYTGTRALRCVWRALGEYAWSVVLNGDPWPANATSVVYFALDVNDDTAGTGPGPGGNLPFGRYNEIGYRWPPTFGLLTGRDLDLTVGLVVQPGDKLALVNCTPASGGLITQQASLGQLLLSVEPLGFAS